MTVISSPHIHSGASISRVMISVILALLPAALMSVYLFGWLAVFLIFTCVLGCMLTEMLCLWLMRRPFSILRDHSAAVTGLLLALTLPALTPWWMALLGSALAIVLGKQVYGGLGYNPFNPALAARVILLISFPLQMTSWIHPMPLGLSPLNLYDPQISLLLFFSGPEALQHSLDAITMASPLGQIKTEWTRGVGVAVALADYPYSTLNALLGLEAGSLGETSALALLIGGAFLLWRRVISWHIPISFLATVALLASIFHSLNPGHYAAPQFHLLAGGLMLCAFFMATDPVTSPVTPIGQLVFGIGCGVLTWCIRTFGGYPEGAMFSVLLMNCAVPLIDHYSRPRVYGH